MEKIRATNEAKSKPVHFYNNGDHDIRAPGARGLACRFKRNRSAGAHGQAVLGAAGAAQARQLARAGEALSADCRADCHVSDPICTLRRVLWIVEYIFIYLQVNVNTCSILGIDFPNGEISAGDEEMVAAVMGAHLA